MNGFIKRLQAAFYQDMTTASLKAAIVVWALFVIVLALLIDNPWVLAGILAYEVLP